MTKTTSKTAQNLPPNESIQKLNKVVDKVLNQILGPQAAQIIYNYLENKYCIHKDEIAEKLGTFSWALREYLGTGAFVIEEVIIENLGLGGYEASKNIDFAERARIVKLA